LNLPILYKGVGNTLLHIMSFDTQTRNRLSSFVGKCRALLCGDFKSPGGEMARQLAHYGIQDTGKFFEVDSLTHLDEPGRETARTLRSILAHKQASAPAAKVWKKFDAAVYDLIQEQGFTVLNRLCALRMAEERKILQFPCISKGLQSDGFELYEYHTGKANAAITKEDRFQHFVFSLFDELSLDLGSLFDRFSPQGLLFPAPQALGELLALINDPALAHIWAEDETIGWIYQYWNSKEERKAMRDASAAPRNSRELAVRNQFFTPRYVVEFLTDNTLGRIWYEMTKGKTSIKNLCRYLVRRPTEVFLVTPSLQNFTLEKSDWVSEVALSGNFSHLPENPTIEELARFALLIEGYELIETLEPSADGQQEAISRFIDRVCNPQLEASERSPHPWQGSTVELWCALFIIQRKRWRECSLNGGNGKSYESACASDDFAARDLWPVLRHTLQHAPENLSQEELLKQPVFIPHRPVKDPREIRLLDPACGSMHFGLYAFDLFETIYEEAWDKGMCPALHEAYSEKTDYLSNVPRLIIEHNIHGIDIDPRAAQIAGLALWLRAQRSWQSAGLLATQRPKVERSNIVCAEPMPGDKEQLGEFTAQLHPAIALMVAAIFDKMQLAGEAGSLLKIEEEITSLVDDAKAAWKQIGKHEGEMFSAAELVNADRRAGTQTQLDIGSWNLETLSTISDSDFFEQAEQTIYQALARYAESATQVSYKRKLFAHDAAQGFAFIDLCRKRYEAVVMNPPFGSPAGALSDYSELYPHSGRDIYGMFVERSHSLRNQNGMIGAIMPRTGLFIGTMENLRINYYCHHSPLKLLLDLGKGVLDATIRTACYVFGSTVGEVACARIGNIKTREERTRQFIEALNSGGTDEDLFIRKIDYFGKLPGSAIAYWISQALASKISELPALDGYLDIRQGIATGDNFRFLRMLCELPNGNQGYQSYSKGGEPVPFVSDETLYVRSYGDVQEMKANAAEQYGSASRTIKNEDTFGKPGLTYSQVNDAGLKFRSHPSDSIYDMKGPVLFPMLDKPVDALLGFLNSSAVEDFMRMMTDGRQWHVSALKKIPMPSLTTEELKRLRDVSLVGCTIARERFSFDETSHFFSYDKDSKSESVSERIEAIIEEIDSIVWGSYGANENELNSFSRQRTLFLERSVDQYGDDDIDVNFPLSTALGNVFGRWDIRCAMGERQAPRITRPIRRSSRLPARHVAERKWTASFGCGVKRIECGRKLSVAGQHRRDSGG
jgi:hypothetical protein